MLPVRQVLLFVLLAIGFRAFRKYMGGCVCTTEGRLDGRLALVIAADTEIGFATTRGLARRGATVVMACQVVDRCNKARLQMINDFGNSNMKEKVGDLTLAESKLSEDTIKGVSSIKIDQLYVRRLHLASADGINAFTKKFISEFKRLNILVVNAVHLSVKPDKTVDGFERNLGMNYLSSFLLSESLVPLMTSSASPDFLSRLVFVSSRLHQQGVLPTAIKSNENEETFSWWKTYSSSQLALITYANHLSTRLNPAKIRVFSVHPGFENRLFGLIIPEPFAYMMTWFGKTPWQSAQSTLSVIFRHPGTEGVYFEDCTAASPNPITFNFKVAANMLAMTKSSLSAYLPITAKTKVKKPAPSKKSVE